MAEQCVFNDWEADEEYDLDDPKYIKSQQVESDEDKSQSISSGTSQRCAYRNKCKVNKAN